MCVHVLGLSLSLSLPHSPSLSLSLQKNSQTLKPQPPNPTTPPPGPHTNPMTQAPVPKPHAPNPTPQTRLPGPSNPQTLNPNPLGGGLASMNPPEGASIPSRHIARAPFAPVRLGLIFRSHVNPGGLGLCRGRRRGEGAQGEAGAGAVTLGGGRRRAGVQGGGRRGAKAQGGGRRGAGVLGRGRRGVGVLGGGGRGAGVLGGGRRGVWGRGRGGQCLNLPLRTSQRTSPSRRMAAAQVSTTWRRLLLPSPTRASRRPDSSLDCLTCAMFGPSPGGGSRVNEPTGGSEHTLSPHHP